MNKWYVIIEAMSDGILYVGINDNSYYGDGQIISEHYMQEQAELACEAYSKQHNIPIFEDYREEQERSI
jgi:hypothetical protein